MLHLQWRVVPKVIRDYFSEMPRDLTVLELFLGAVRDRASRINDDEGFYHCTEVQCANDADNALTTSRHAPRRRPRRVRMMTSSPHNYVHVACGYLCGNQQVRRVQNSSLSFLGDDAAVWLLER